MLQTRTGFINQKCPKCGGNLFQSEDPYADGYLISYYEHESCLQCGYECHERYIDLLTIEEKTNGEKRELLPV